MNQERTTAGLDLPHVSEEDKLRRVLSSALKSRLGNHPVFPEPTDYQYWDATHFGLEKVRVFQDASVEEQGEILRVASYGLLEEAYFIEKAGVGYMAKMVLLAETTEERMLYALFSGDEVTHLAQIKRFLPNHAVVIPSCFSNCNMSLLAQRSGAPQSEPSTLPDRKQLGISTDNTFLHFIADLVESQDKTVLLFVLQVVLEGWGLSHYRSLAQDCRVPDLASTFKGFLQDEARHHATGFTLFNQMSVSQASRATIIEVLALFLRMVQVGPQSVVAAIERVKGHLSRQQKVRVFEELDTETHSGKRLALLHFLMRGEEVGIVQKLQERGAFQPFPAERCV